MIVLIGLPNAGKSAIIKALTGKDLEVAPYPFTTRLPAPVMMPFENAWVELIDTPPVTADAFDPELVALIKRADLCLFVVDLSDDDVLETVEILAHGLEERRAVPGYTSTPDQGEGTGMTPVKTILVGTRLDLDAGKVNMELLREFIDGRFPVHPLSPETGEGVEAFRVVLWEALDVIRIYPKAPGKKVTREEPMYIHKGGTVIEFASKLHRDFGENLKSARVWGSSLFDGQHVKSSHVLEDGDVVEFSM